MKRKIVQIAAVSETVGNCLALFALADDGTLWRLYDYYNSNENWYEVKELPDAPEEGSGYSY